MIIHRAFYREAALVTLGITAVLVVIVVFQGLSVFLGRAAMGEESKDVVMTLLGLQTLRKLDLLLPLALYFGILLTLSRWYRDSEMTVLAACGIGLTQLLRPVLLFALALAVVVGLGSFFFTLYASRQTDLVKHESARVPEVSRMTQACFPNPKAASASFTPHAWTRSATWRTCSSVARGRQARRGRGPDRPPLHRCENR